MSASQSHPTEALTEASRLETWSWRILMATIFIAPLAIGTLPFQEPYLYAWQSVLHMIVLGFGLGTSALTFTMAVVVDRVPLRWHWVGWLLLASIGLTGISTAFATDLPAAVIGDASDTFSFTNIAIIALLAFMIFQLVRSAERRSELINTIAYSGVVMAVFALIAQVGDISMFTPDWYHGEKFSFVYQRGGELMGNPDWVGQILVVSALLLLGRALFGHVRKNRIVYLSLAVLVSLSAVLTLQRAAWVALFLGAFTLVVYAIRKKSVSRSAIVFVVGGVIILGLLAGIFAYDGFAGVAKKVTTAVEDITANKPFSRITMAEEAVGVIAQSPLLGAGPNHFRQAWHQARTDETILTGSDTFISDPHSLPFMVAASLGIPTFILLAALTAIILFGALRKTRESDDSIMLSVTIATCAMLLILLVSLSEIYYLALLGCMLGCLAAWAQPNEADCGNKIAPRVFAISATLFAVLFMVTGGIKLYGFRAMTVAQQSETRAEGCERFLSAGANIPYFAQSAQLGAILATQEIQKTGSPLADQTSTLISKAAIVHSGDAMVIRAIAQYKVTAGGLFNDESSIKEGVALAQKAIDVLGYDSQAYSALITGLASAGQADKAKQLVDAYLKVVPNNERIMQLKQSLYAVDQNEGIQW